MLLMAVDQELVRTIEQYERMRRDVERQLREYRRVLAESKEAEKAVETLRRAGLLR